MLFFLIILFKRIIPIDGSKSEWDDDDDEEEEIESRKLNENLHRRISPPVDRTNRLKLNSASSNDSSSTLEHPSNSSLNKRSSNLKKSDRSSSRSKSPKSVTFSLDENIHNQQTSNNFIFQIYSSHFLFRKSNI